MRGEIRHILGRVSQVERLFETVNDKHSSFNANLDDLMTGYNTKRPHMSLNLDAIETPQPAYIRKMPKKRTTVSDTETGEVYNAKKE